MLCWIRQVQPPLQKITAGVRLFSYTSTGVKYLHIKQTKHDVNSTEELLLQRNKCLAKGQKQLLAPNAVNTSECKVKGRCCACQTSDNIQLLYEHALKPRGQQFCVPFCSCPHLHLWLLHAEPHDNVKSWKMSWVRVLKITGVLFKGNATLV